MVKFNVLNHELVPRHEVLSDAEAKKILEKFALAEKQFPYLLIHDPVAKAVSAKPGQIVKITRDSPTSGVVVTYRLVAVLAETEEE